MNMDMDLNMDLNMNMDMDLNMNMNTSWTENGSVGPTSWTGNGSVGPTAAACISFGQDVVNEFVDSSFAKDKHHVIVFLGVVCALGTTGNLLVILVNTRRKDKSSAAIFVLTLAAVDLFICALKIPLKIVEMQHVTYTSTVWCKSSPYFTLASLLSSVFLLTAIAVDRYRAVARPVKYRVANLTAIAVDRYRAVARPVKYRVANLTAIAVDRYRAVAKPVKYRVASLTAIAVDRYRAVARPVKYRVAKNRSVPLLCVLTVLAGFLLSIPAVLLQDEVPGIRVGPACETVSFCSSVGGVTNGRVYFGVTAAVFFASVLAMTVLYALVSPRSIP
ncbi:neuromedin-K receptor-like [Branchiostoma floridae]|uniref:Neuromedin-K receptor-like n=1 Tax=Branchiostoma floridae TaxID=7739 RepID=A0A9J7MTY5_BRAFL|nr:neuromedin-K receptor-like [Branchiostoma floridae]